MKIRIQKITPFLLLGLLGPIASAASGVEWKTDMEAARQKAKAEGKPMLLNFTGSDWCPPCIQLKRAVFSQDTFKEFAEEELVLVEVDFPRDKKQSEEVRKQNRALAKEHGVEQFPTILILSPEGGTMNRTSGYRGKDAEAYVNHLKEVLSEGKASG